MSDTYWCQTPRRATPTIQVCPDESESSSRQRAIREVREETGVHLECEPTFVGTHEHLDGLGQPARSHFFRVDAPTGLPPAWRHVVSGDGEDAGLVFECRFEESPTLWPVQSIFWLAEGLT